MGWRGDRFSAIGKRRRGINAEDAEKKGESQPPLADRTWGLQRKSESFALALKGGLYGGTVFFGEHETKCGERFRRRASYYWKRAVGPKDSEEKSCHRVVRSCS